MMMMPMMMKTMNLKFRKLKAMIMRNLQKKKTKVDDKKSNDKSNDKSKSYSDYINKLKAHIKKEGKCELGSLGSVVKKPTDVKTKLSVIIGENPSIFKRSGSTVSLA